MSQQVDIIGLLESGIKAEEMRQKTIASNIANMETPGYRRLEVRFEELAGESDAFRLEHEPGGRGAGGLLAQEHVRQTQRQ